MNILILGTPFDNLINAITKSKYPYKIYTVTQDFGYNYPNIEYTDFDDLAKKAKALKIDLIIVTDKNLVQEGIAESLKPYLLNIISINKKWLNLENKIIAKQLVSHYSINYPEIIKTPLAFPIVLKTENDDSGMIIHSISELVQAKDKFYYDKIFLEEYLEGENYTMLSFWDRKNLFSFPIDAELTEVQRERLELYKTKLNFMLSDEKADFLGFFTTQLLWAKNDWYILGYKMNLDENIDLTYHTKDFLYILDLAIYQKINEI